MAKRRRNRIGWEQKQGESSKEEAQGEAAEDSRDLDGAVGWTGKRQGGLFADRRSDRGSGFDRSTD